MSTAIAAEPAAAAPSSAVTVKNVTFGRLLRSEWIKLWSLRSTWWTLASTAVVLIVGAVGFSALIYFITKEAGAEELGMMGLSGPGALVWGYPVASLVVAVLGCMVITGEYGTGMIRSTFASAPRRLDAFAAKGVVLALVAASLTTLSLAIAWAVTLPLLPEAAAVDLTDGADLRVLYGTVMYVTLLALIAYGLGALIRHTAGAIFTVAAIFLVLPTVFNVALIGASRYEWIGTIYKFLPDVAGSQITSAGPSQAAMLAEFAGVEMLDPWVGIGVLALYTAAVLTAGAVRLKRSDP
ncbi:ABC transporter permease [Myceligenerans crystallogenes]|uniref:ABC transporter permease subunit n=1 Tax=Myceligenerans crystallogenes TaxID=316335 RepID=A0ABN2NB10_9MICO